LVLITNYDYVLIAKNSMLFYSTLAMFFFCLFRISSCSRIFRCTVTACLHGKNTIYAHYYVFVTSVDTYILEQSKKCLICVFYWRVFYHTNTSFCILFFGNKTGLILFYFSGNRWSVKTWKKSIKPHGLMPMQVLITTSSEI